MSLAQDDSTSPDPLEFKNVDKDQIDSTLDRAA